jgi:hypothetical protein
MNEIKNKPNKVLVFSAQKRFIAVFHSQLEAAKSFKANPISIHYACTGVSISCKGLYFRQLPDSVEIGWEDFGVLRLKEYDELCGVERKVYPTRRMNRIGMKYKKKQTKNKKNESTDCKQIKASVASV